MFDGETMNDPSDFVWSQSYNSCVEFLEPGSGFLFKAIERVMNMAQKIEVHRDF